MRGLQCQPFCLTRGMTPEARCYARARISTTQSPCELRATCRLTLDKADIEVVNAKDAEEVLFMGALSAKWTNNDAIDKARHGFFTPKPFALRPCVAVLSVGLLAPLRHVLYAVV